LQIAFCQLLNTRVGVSRDPLAECEIVFQHSVASRAMIRLADEAKLELAATVASDRKPYRIVITLPGQTWTICGVTQIAKFSQFLIGRLCAFVARSGTMTTPSSAQRKTRRMKPPAIFQLARWDEERTGHPLKLLYRDEGIVLSGRMDR
jgi:hypothetical protein